MSTENDTVENTETESAEINGTAEVETSTDSVTSTENQDQIDKAAYDAALARAAKADELEKELQKRDMELNQRRNNEKKAELERLAAEGKDKERADALQAELDEIREKQEAADRAKEAEDFRKNILKGFSQEVREAADDLGLTWDDASTYEEAETQLKAKLDKLSARMGSKQTQEEEPDAPEIHANNPAGEPSKTEIDRLRTMSAAEMRKALPIAPSR